MGGRQLSECGFDGSVLEWSRCIVGDAEYRFLGQDQVPSLNVSGGECTFAILEARASGKTSPANEG